MRRLRRGAFDWLVVTSKVGARELFSALNAHGLDARILHPWRVAAVGQDTSLELLRRGLRPDAIAAESAGSTGILAALAGEPNSNALPYRSLLSRRAVQRNVLLVQSTHAPASLEEELARRGHRVTRLALHRVVPNPELGRPLPEHDVIYFASPSGVRAIWQKYGEAAFSAVRRRSRRTDLSLRQSGS